ncbi:tyrosine-type recombinase/integrase [Anaerosphaera multitolerans]|uniref:Integrase n=1 Tax=Anaerosphaera multitolerans TaxID=2487351 RepID=A0A437S959_9FIRM|nr:integrase [Anaerosphaera multitolerans]
MDKRITPHTLRHTHISLLAQAGVSLQEIKGHVGHGDGDVTEKIYLHITKEFKFDTLKKYEALFKA